MFESVEIKGKKYQLTDCGDAVEVWVEESDGVFIEVGYASDFDDAYYLATKIAG